MFLHISSSRVKIQSYTENQLPWLLGSAVKIQMVWVVEVELGCDKKKSTLLLSWWEKWANWGKTDKIFSQSQEFPHIVFQCPSSLSLAWNHCLLKLKEITVCDMNFVAKDLFHVIGIISYDMICIPVKECNIFAYIFMYNENL